MTRPPSAAALLASIQVQSVLYDKRLGRDGPELHPHPISLVEEPEAHLHPQAQYELPDLLTRIEGQVIVSTHSTHMASVLDPRSIRLIRNDSARIKVVDLRPSDESDQQRARRPSMHSEEMEKVRRMVERPFGELLFASIVVLGDGATERALLPPLIRRAIPQIAHKVCVVDTGGMESSYATAIVKFANMVDIPWILFADTDGPGRSAANTLLTSHNQTGLGSVVWASSDGSESSSGAAIEQMLVDFEPDLCVAAALGLGYKEDAGNIMSFLKAKKGVIGGLLAAELVSRHPEPWKTSDGVEVCAWPEAICKLLDIIKTMENGPDERILND